MPDHCGDLKGLGGVLDEVVAVHEEREVVGAITLLGDDHGVREQRRGPEVIKEKPQGRHGSCPERGVKMKKESFNRGALAQVESLQLSHMSKIAVNVHKTLTQSPTVANQLNALLPRVPRVFLFSTACFTSA